MERKRIVITGMGAVTPIGIGADAYWQALVRGESGIAPVEKPELQGLPIAVAAEVKGFDAKACIPPKLARDLEDFMQYAYVSAQEALTASGLEPDPWRTGIVMSTALGGLAAIEGVQRAKSERRKRSAPSL